MVVVAVYHERHSDEEMAKSLGERQLSLMSSAGAITTGKVRPGNLGAFFRYREGNVFNHELNSYWNLEIEEKLNPDDDVMHSTYCSISSDRVWDLVHITHYKLKRS